MLTVKQYETVGGQSPFARWFDDLNSPAAAKVTAAITRLANGNFGDVKAVGSGVSERRIDFGPGYRVYFAREGQQIIILLGGGSKKGQSKDIAAAIERWKDYKRRKNLGEK